MLGLGNTPLAVSGVMARRSYCITILGRWMGSGVVRVVAELPSTARIWKMRDSGKTTFRTGGQRRIQMFDDRLPPPCLRLNGVDLVRTWWTMALRRPPNSLAYVMRSLLLRSASLPCVPLET